MRGTSVVVLRWGRRARPCRDLPQLRFEGSFALIDFQLSREFFELRYVSAIVLAGGIWHHDATIITRAPDWTKVITMPAAPKSLDAVRIGRLFLDLDNPRHVPFTAEKDAIQ